MSITVTQAFRKPSALRELADCYSRNQLSQQDYESHRSQLIDYLSGIPVQLDPVVQMLLLTQSGPASGGGDVTEPQDVESPSGEITSTPARGHEDEADLSSVTRVTGRAISTHTAPPASSSLPMPANDWKGVRPMQWIVGIVVGFIIIGAALFFSHG